MIVRKVFECEVKAQSKDGGATTFRVVASTGTQDRQGEFLDPKGATLVRGAQLLYGHNYGDIKANIGVVTSITIEGNHVIAEGEFDDQIPEHTNAIIAAKKAKKTPPSLNMVSVGFNPKTIRMANGEVRTLSAGEWVWPEPGMTYLEWEMVELSFVPVPANAEAELLEARSFEGRPGKEFVAMLRAMLREETPAPIPPDDAPPAPAPPAPPAPEPEPEPEPDELEKRLAEVPPPDEVDALFTEAEPTGAGTGAST